MKTAAILPALGIGDALLMMIGSHHLFQAGYQVTTFHNNLPELASWFPNQSFEKWPVEKDLIRRLDGFDLIIAENDNSERMKRLVSAFRQVDQLSIFYPTYSASKHGPIHPLDKIFDPNRPMAENIAEAIGSLLGKAVTKDNGISPPPHLQYQRYSKRIVIHPTSREPSKNWSARQFCKLAQQLKKKGFEPNFCVGPSERSEWKHVAAIGCELPDFPTLTELASFIYESSFHIGNDSLLGHLASNLNIPTIIIANDAKRMRLWRPGWLPGQIVLPPQWIPNPRPFRWKNNHWQHFVSTRSVLRAFETLC